LGTLRPSFEIRANWGKTVLRDGSGRRLLWTLFGAMGLSAVLASTASAGPLLADAGDCEEQQLSEPFKPWVDPMRYTPVRDGGFERNGKRWRLEGGAEAGAGNEPWKVAGEHDGRSLVVPEGAQATSPAICVGLAEPTLRFFARGSDDAAPAMLVEVLFEDASGAVHSFPIGADAGGNWHPTTIMPVLVNLLPLLPGEQTPVAFRFTALSGDFRIDDVYVDPWCQR